MTGDGLSRGLSDMWRSIVLIVPAALLFAGILLAGYLVARLLRTVVVRVLRRAGLDRAIERGAAAGLFPPGRPTASEVGGKLTFAGVLLVALQLAFGVWGPNPVSDLLSDLLGWLPRLLVAIVLVVVATTIARTAQDLIAGALGGLSYGRLVGRVVSGVIVVLGVIAALDQVRIAAAVTQPLLITVLAVVAGVVIVGVGGGLIRPMQQRWETWLERAEAEAATIREHVGAYRAAAADPGETQVISYGNPDRPSWASTPTQLAPATTTADEHAPDETQVIAPRRGDNEATVIHTAAGDTTIVNPGPNDTLVIGSGTEGIESTQVIPPGDEK
ncbi:mechanosensitive ion channel family protein [Paractinoplanes maris]|uniref:mechanosensitive ion channel family protein n=1 Tax=Paractinoplanes maris TaxID=1734446 RepID=UPI0020222D28|nr:hypothetical protein [Actinoplanes maris]